MILMGFWDKLNQLFTKKDDEEKEVDPSQYLGSQDEMYGALDKIKSEYDAAVEAGKHNVEDDWPEDPGYKYLEYEGASKDEIVNSTAAKYDALLADKLADILVEYKVKSDLLEADKVGLQESAESKKQDIEEGVKQEKRAASNKIGRAHV